MVEDRVRDGRRIAQLLASEVTGLATGPLGAISMIDADPDAEAGASADPGGTRAYDLAHSDDEFATVHITEETASVVFTDPVEVDRIQPVEGIDDLSVESGANGPALVVESGAAVKHAVDVIAALLE